MGWYVQVLSLATWLIFVEFLHISEQKISALNNTKKNKLEEIINEYGDSLTEKEKISVLIDIMKKYMAIPRIK